MCCLHHKASLIDIDLQVMRQLLMLNDQVEEMKWQRRQQQQQRRVLLSSTCVTPSSIDDIDFSDATRQWSRSAVPDTPDSWGLLPLDRRSRDDDDEDEEATLKYPTPSALSLLRAGATNEDRFSDTGSVDALDRPDPDTPEVFSGTPQSTATAAGTRTAVARTSPPKNLGDRTPRDGEDLQALRSKEVITSERRSPSSDVDHKSLRSATKTKDQDPHSVNTDSFHDFCTYVEMLI